MTQGATRIRAWRILPRSLRARLMLLILGAVLFAQAATFLAISHYRRNFLDNVAPDLMATTIRTLRAAIAQIPEEDRASFVAEASQGEWRLEARPLPPRRRFSADERRRFEERAHERGWTLRPEAGRGQGQGAAPGSPSGQHPGPGSGPDRGAYAGVDGAPPHLPRARPFFNERPAYMREPWRWNDDDPRNAMRGIIRRLNEQLGEGTRVALSRGPEPALYISLSSAISYEEGPATRAWLVISLERISPPVNTPLLVLWLGGLGLILLTAAWFSWHISRPITSLALAADRLAAGEPQRVEPAGPRETRVLGERFNAMLDALHESDTVRRTLLAGLPHDLKGPLSRMRLRTELADDSLLKEGLRKDAQDMQHIVDQFIGFVRGTDRATYHFVPMDLGDWLRERVHAWKGTGTAIDFVPPDDEIVVHGDPVALGRLVDNLIQNALQHGAPPIGIALAATARHAVLTVHDQGPGISPERRAEAMQPFSRLDAARSRSGNVGLGLALIEAIAKAHGGTVLLGQGPQGGLQVDIQIPLSHL